MSNFCLLMLFSIALTVTSYAPPTRFCDDMEALCLGFGQAHLACGGILDHNAELGTTPLKIEVDEQLYLDLHNELRNMIACGEPKMMNLAGEIFPRAFRLQKFVWDEELAWAANLNAKTCSGFPDCKLTHTHRFVGQNLGLRISYQPHDITELIKHVIKGWFLEYLNTPVSIVDSYSHDTIKADEQFTFNDMHKIEHILKDKSLLRENSHFAEIIRDRSNRLGCALYSCGESETGMPFSYYMVCNYQSMNIEGSTVYTRADISGSGCEVRSKEYTCLCLDPTESRRDSNLKLFEKSGLVLTNNGTRVVRIHTENHQKMKFDSHCNRIFIPRRPPPVPKCKCPQSMGSKIVANFLLVALSYWIGY